MPFQYPIRPDKEKTHTIDTNIIPPMARLASALAVLLALSFSTLALAQSSSATPTTSDTATATAASIYPGGTNWAYFGCYNETTLYNGTNGARAIAGLLEASDIMTVETCLNYCRGNGYQVAGLEYTRFVSLCPPVGVVWLLRFYRDLANGISECYCANYLNSLSAKLPDTSCGFECKGNSSEICGGYLALSVYKKADAGTKGDGTNVRPNQGVGSLLALGIALTVLFVWA